MLARQLHLLNSRWGLVVVYSAALAFNMFLLRGFFEEIPQELLDSALIDGAGRSRPSGAWRCRWPARPWPPPRSSFLGAWDEFTWALTSINDEKLYTLPIALRLFQQQHGTEWGLVFAASAVAVLPTILVFVIFQRHFIKGVMSGAVKGAGQVSHFCRSLARNAGTAYAVSSSYAYTCE